VKGVEDIVGGTQDGHCQDTAGGCDCSGMTAGCGGVDPERKFGSPVTRM
jgi:hypothetical protein